MGPLISDYYKRLILLTVILLSSGHCITIKYVQMSSNLSLSLMYKRVYLNNVHNNGTKAIGIDASPKSGITLKRELRSVVTQDCKLRYFTSYNIIYLKMIKRDKIVLILQNIFLIIFWKVSF